MLGTDIFGNNQIIHTTTMFSYNKAIAIFIQNGAKINP